MLSALSMVMVMVASFVAGSAPAVVVMVRACAEPTLPRSAASIVMAALPRKRRRVRVKVCNRGMVVVTVVSFSDCSQATGLAGAGVRRAPSTSPTLPGGESDLLDCMKSDARRPIYQTKVLSILRIGCLVGRRSQMRDPKAARPLNDGVDRDGQSRLPPATVWTSADGQYQSLMDVC